MNFAKPQAEHEWLQKLVGEWTYESPTEGENCSGTQTVRSIGGLWIIGEGKGKIPDGSPATMILTVGYDPAKGRYCGTWIGSMMANLWVYDGELDSNDKVLSLYSEGPAFEGEGTAKYKDVITWIDDDRYTFSGHMQGPDADILYEWPPFHTSQPPAILRRPLRAFSRRQRPKELARTLSKRF